MGRPLGREGYGVMEGFRLCSWCMKRWLGHVHYVHGHYVHGYVHVAGNNSHIGLAQDGGRRSYARTNKSTFPNAFDQRNSH